MKRMSTLSWCPRLTAVGRPTGSADRWCARGAPERRRAARTARWSERMPTIGPAAPLPSPRAAPTAGTGCRGGGARTRRRGGARRRDRRRATARPTRMASRSSASWPRGEAARVLVEDGERARARRTLAWRCARRRAARARRRDRRARRARCGSARRSGVGGECGSASAQRYGAVAIGAVRGRRDRGAARRGGSGGATARRRDRGGSVGAGATRRCGHGRRRGRRDGGARHRARPRRAPARGVADDGRDTARARRHRRARREQHFAAQRLAARSAFGNAVCAPDAAAADAPAAASVTPSVWPAAAPRDRARRVGHRRVLLGREQRLQLRRQADRRRRSSGRLPCTRLTAAAKSTRASRSRE